MAANEFIQFPPGYSRVLIDEASCVVAAYTWSHPHCVIHFQECGGTNSDSGDGKQSLHHVPRIHRDCSDFTCSILLTSCPEMGQAPGQVKWEQAHYERQFLGASYNGSVLRS
jgi:hypothetical protein